VLLAAGSRIEPLKLTPGRTVESVATGDLLERITIDPNVCFGRPTVRGTRIWVGLILGLLADGMTIEELLAEYPSLSDDDIRACLSYGARLSVGRYVDVA